MTPSQACRKNRVRLINHNAVAIIPARGGSKGLPRKNILDLCGKPLVAYSIHSALEADCFNHVVVTTDDEEIADISRDHGAEVPFLRPKHMASDTATVTEGVEYTLKRLFPHGRCVTLKAVLYPTSPFRAAGMIRNLVSKVSQEGFTFVCTVKKAKRPNWSYFALDEGRVDPLGAPAYFRDHAFYRPYGVMTVDRLSFRDRREYAQRIENEIELIDIDTAEDFDVAEEVIRNNLYDFTHWTPPAETQHD